MRLRPLLAATAVLALLVAAPAAAFDRLYVFGDSLVDSGNGRALSPGDVPTDPVGGLPGYPSGRFTNGAAGRNFADYLSRALGFGDATAYLNGTAPHGLNFAVGGATVGYSPAETKPDLKSEITGLPASAQANPLYALYKDDNYETARNAGLVTPIDADSLVLVAAGGNDVRGFTAGTDPATFVGSVAAQYLNSLQALYADGARNFVLIGVPDIGQLPGVYGTPVQATATALTTALNQAYQGVANLLTAQVGTQGIVRLIDIASLQTATAADRSLVAAGNEHRSCFFDGGQAAVDGGCVGYLYYDRIHPTDAIHQRIAAAILTALPEPESWTLMIAGFGLTGVALRRARRAGALAAVA